MARSFNGSAKIVAPLVTTASTGVTASIWINPTNTLGANRCPFYVGDDNSNGWGAIWLQGGQAMIIYLGGVTLGGGSTNVSPNVWQNLILEQTGTGGSYSWKLYLNNSQIDSTSSAAVAVTPTTQTNIGTAYSGGPWTGGLADFAVWNVSLTANERAGLVAGLRANSIRPGNILGYWPLDGITSPEPDLSGYANSGTLTGTAKANGPPIAMFTPRWPINDVFPSAAPSFISAWAAQSNIPIIGAGTY